LRGERERIFIREQRKQETTAHLKDEEAVVVEVDAFATQEVRDLCPVARMAIQRVLSTRQKKRVDRDLANPQL
jgi:hypothetical protein